jgi:uncharacterized repeat protein (TIGR01451 family)
MYRQTGDKSLLFLLILSCLSVSALGSERLIFPRFSFDPGTFTGLALANLAPEAMDVTLTAYGTSGEVLSGPGFQNPATIRLGSGQRSAKLIQEIFGAELSPLTVAWVEVTAPESGVTGFFLFLNAQVTQFDGADLPTASQEVIFNLVRHGQGYSTELNLVNPGASEANVTLTLVRPQLPDLQAAFSLPGRAVARHDAATLFQLASIPAGSYVRARASAGEIAGFEFVRTAGDLLGLNAKPSSERLNQLFFPQMVMGDPWQSELGIVNYTSQPVIVTIYARTADGALFGADVLEENPVTRGVGPRESIVLDLAELFGLRGTQARDGWLEVACDSASINGYLSYGIPSVGSLAGIAAPASPRRQFVFSHVTTASGFFTGLALLNPATMAINARVLALDLDGNRIGLADNFIRPGQRVSALVTELIEGSGNRAGGMLWVSTDLPVYGSSLFGAERVLANVPPQAAPPTYQPDENEPRVQLAPPLAVVQPGRTQKFSASGVPGTPVWMVDGIPGGSPELGLIDAAGNYTAPASPPAPSYRTVGAEIAGRRGGASVDILKKEVLLGGLGILQSVVYLQSLQRIFEVELLGAAVSGVGASPAAQTQQASQSELFQVIPPAVKSSVNTYSDNIVKLLAYTALNGSEYVLLLGKENGTVTRLDPTTRVSRVVYTGLNQPTSMALDTSTGGLLVAEATRIVSINRSFLEAGLGTASAGVDGGGGSSLQTGLVDLTGITGVGVDPCTGDIYLSQAATGTLYRLDRETGAVTTVVTGLSEPGHLLVLYRRGLPCPDAVQILVAEPGAERIALVDPSRGIVVSWIPASGVRDLSALPADNPYTGVFSIAYGVFVESGGEINIVEVPDQYEEPPGEEETGGPCVSPVVFPDANLAAAIREALEIAPDQPITCEALAELTTLNASGRRIQSLVGLQFAFSLRNLDVSRNRIRSLVPIADLTALEEVDAAFNLISETGLLANLNNLRRLDLAHNLVGDLSGLGDPILPAAGRGFRAHHLGSLEELDLSYNRLENLNPLSGLSSLRRLNLERNGSLSGLEPLQSMVNLQELIAGYNAISDLTPLSSLQQLGILFLPFNRIISVHPLVLNGGLGAGDVIDLRGNPFGPGACGDLVELQRRGIALIADQACEPDLVAEVVPSAEYVAPGENVGFEVTVRNVSQAPAYQVILDNQFSAGASLVSATTPVGQCLAADHQVTCTRALLPPGEIWTIEILLQVEGGEQAITDQVSVSSDRTDRNPADNVASASVTVAQADLAVAKWASAGVVATGRDLHYTLRVTNQGPTRAEDIHVVDTLPDGIRVYSTRISSGGCNQVGGAVECFVASLDAGQSVDITISATVRAVSGVLTNQVAVEAATPDPDSSNNSASVSTRVAEADLSISKTDSADPASPGSALSYTLTVTNLGPDAAPEVLVTDTLPAGVSFVSVSPTECSFVSGTVSCLFATLPSGSSRVITINTTVSQGFVSIVNQAQASSPATDPNPENNVDAETTQVQVADLEITKFDSPDPVSPGDFLYYSIVVTNLGPDDATNVVITDPVPSELTVWSVEGPDCTTVGNTVTCTLASLATDNSTQITIAATVGALTETITNTVTVTADQGDPDPDNNSATVTTEPARADLVLTKSDSEDPVTTGSELIYTLTLTNQGPDTATNVTLTDTLPAGLTISFVDPYFYCLADLDNNSVSCEFPPMEPLSQQVVTIYTEVVASSGTLSNTATASALQLDPNPADNTATETTEVAVVDLEIQKESTPSPVSCGDDPVHRVRVINHGPHAATGIIFRDQLASTDQFIETYEVISAPPGVEVSCQEQINGTSYITCTVLGAVPAEAAVEVDVYTFFNCENEGPTLDDTAWIVAVDQTDTNPANDSVTVQNPIAVADLGVTLTDDPDPVLLPQAGPGSVEYTVTVTNLGPDAAKNTTIFFTAPSGWSIVTAPANCSPSGNFTNCNLGTILPLDSVQVVLEVSIPISTPAGDYSADAGVFSSEIDPASGNDTDTETTTVVLP